MAMMKTLDPSPIPNQRIARGIQAMGGIGRRTSIRGEATESRSSYHPIRIPSGTAKAKAIPTPTRIRTTLIPMCPKSFSSPTGTVIFS